MGGKRFQADREKAEQLADESVRLYETAIRFLWEHIDKKSGHMKARWGGANCRRRGIGLFESQNMRAGKPSVVMSTTCRSSAARQTHAVVKQRNKMTLVLILLLAFCRVLDPRSRWRTSLLLPIPIGRSVSRFGQSDGSQESQNAAVRDNGEDVAIGRKLHQAHFVVDGKARDLAL
jgi:hypothetical protein